MLANSGDLAVLCILGLMECASMYNTACKSVVCCRCSGPCGDAENVGLCVGIPALKNSTPHGGGGKHGIPCLEIDGVWVKILERATLF